MNNNSFDLVKEINKLKEKYTSESVDQFLDYYTTNAKIIGRNSFNGFLNKQIEKRLLVEKQGEIDENGFPFYAIPYSTFLNLESDGFYLTAKEKLMFEVIVAFLGVEKNKSLEKIVYITHEAGSIAKRTNKPYMECLRKNRLLNSEEAKKRLNEIYKYYENLEEL